MRKVLIALFLVIAATAVLYILQHRESQKEREDRAKELLLAFDDRAVTGVLLMVEATPWRFERGAEGWRIVDPIPDAANEQALLEVLAAMRKTSVVRVIEEPEALADYGLDPPVRSIELSGVDVPRLDLGNLAPTGDALFARLEGRDGVLVLQYSAFIGAPLNRTDPDLLRDDRLLDLLSSDVSSVELSTAAGDVGLEREGDEWWIVRPRRLPAADAVVAEIISVLERTRVSEFHDGSDAADPAFGLGRVGERIVVRAAGASREIVLGAAYGDGMRYVARDDRTAVLGVRAGGLDELPLELPALVTRRLSKVNRYEVAEFRYRRGEDGFDARKQGEGWVAADGSAVAPENALGFLARVLEMPVSGWESTAAASASAEAVLEYRLDGGEEGSIEFLPGGLARASAAADVAFRVRAGPPAVPRTN